MLRVSSIKIAHLSREPRITPILLEGSMFHPFYWRDPCFTHSIGGIHVSPILLEGSMFLIVLVFPVVLLLSSFVSVLCLMPNIAGVSWLTILDFPDNTIARKDMISPSFLFGSSHWQCFYSFVLLNFFVFVLLSDLCSFDKVFRLVFS